MYGQGNGRKKFPPPTERVYLRSLAQSTKKTLYDHLVEIAAILICVGLLAMVAWGSCKVAGASPYQVTMAVDPAIDADGYRVSFGTEIDKKVYSQDVGQMTEFTIDDLKCGTTYYFEVRAYNETGSSVPTNTLEYTTDECPTLPTIPDGWTIDSLVIKPLK